MPYIWQYRSQMLIVNFATLPPIVQHREAVGPFIHPERVKILLTVKILSQASLFLLEHQVGMPRAVEWHLIYQRVFQARPQNLIALDPCPQLWIELIKIVEFVFQNLKRFIAHLIRRSWIPSCHRLPFQTAMTRVRFLFLAPLSALLVHVLWAT